MEVREFLPGLGVLRAWARQDESEESWVWLRHCPRGPRGPRRVHSKTQAYPMWLSTLATSISLAYWFYWCSMMFPKRNCDISYPRWLFSDFINDVTSKIIKILKVESPEGSMFVAGQASLLGTKRCRRLLGESGTSSQRRVFSDGWSDESRCFEAEDPTHGQPQGGGPNLQPWPDQTELIFTSVVCWSSAFRISGINS